MLVPYARKNHNVSNFNPFHDFDELERAFFSDSSRSVSVKETSVTSKASIRWELTQSKQSAFHGIIHRLQFFFQRTG